MIHFINSCFQKGLTVRALEAEEFRVICLNAGLMLKMVLEQNLGLRQHDS